MHRFVWMAALITFGCTDGAALRDRLSGRDPNPAVDGGLDAQILDATATDIGLVDQGRDARPDRSVPNDMRRSDRGLPDDGPPSPDARPRDARPGDAQPNDAMLDACVPQIEICDGVDNNCNGQIDEGFDQPETCNAQDDDCDGRVDENVNAMEACNGRDDDCDGFVDEGTLNACDQCGATPPEICNGDDDDCDGRVDEAGCLGFVLDTRDDRWRTPIGLNTNPLVQQGRLTAAFATQLGAPQIWAFEGQGSQLHVYDIDRDRWSAVAEIRDFEQFGAVQTAYSVPNWWVVRHRPEATTADVTLTRAGLYRIYSFDPRGPSARLVRQGLLAESWEADGGAPEIANFNAMLIDLHDARDFWPGDVGVTCNIPGAMGGPVIAVLSQPNLYTADAGRCARFMARQRTATWAGFALPNAPDSARILAWDFLSRPDGTGMHIVLTAPPGRRRQSP